MKDLPETPEHSLEIMKLLRDFIATDDARGAMESWARVNRPELWRELDRQAAHDMQTSAANYVQHMLTISVTTMVTLFEKSQRDE